MAQPLPAFSAPSVTPSPNLDDLASWSEAAVCDRLFQLYAGIFAEEERARHAARLHWLCWRAHLAQLSVQGRAARRALTRALSDARLDTGAIERADAAVIDELTDLLLHKYRRAPLQAKDYITRIVLAAARVVQTA
jgi:hypothetical protein